MIGKHLELGMWKTLSWVCEQHCLVSTVSGKRSATLWTRKSITGFRGKGLNFLKLCRCCRFWAGKDPGFLNECRLNYFELSCSVHSYSLSSAMPIRGDRRKQEQMSSPRQLGAWQWRSRALPCGSGLGSRSSAAGPGWRQALCFPNSSLHKTYLLGKALVSHCPAGRSRARITGTCTCCLEA